MNYFLKAMHKPKRITYRMQFRKNEKHVSQSRKFTTHIMVSIDNLTAGVINS
jgi:hypothetical protein